MNLTILKKQIELLRLRRQATRIAVQLYQASTCPADNDTVTVLFDRCNHAQEAAEISATIEELKALAEKKGIGLDL